MKTLSLPFVAVTLMGAAVASPAWAKKPAAKAHQHGQATLSIAVEGLKLQADLDIPGDSVFGFEHKPATEAEKAAVQTALATFKDKAEQMLVLPAANGCKLTESDVETDAHGDHNEVEVEYKFTCAATPAGASVTLGFLDAFPRLKAVKVQVLSGANQTGKTVTSAKEPVQL